MMTIKKTFAIIACFVVLNACKNQINEVAPSNLNTNEVVVKNGALHFKDLNVFTKIVKQLNDGDLDLDTWTASIGFTNSLSQSQNNTLDIPDPVFANILNAEGIYFIGNEAHKVGKTYEYVTNEQNIEQLRNIDVNSKEENIAGMKAHKIKFGAAAKAFNARFQGAETLSRIPYTSRHDLQAELHAWSRTYAVYSSVGVRIKGRKFRKGGLFGSSKWRDDEMDFASISYECQTEVCVGGQCSGEAILTGDDSVTNKKKLSITINYSAGTGTWHVTDYIEADFSYRDEGLSTVNWNNIRFE